MPRTRDLNPCAGQKTRSSAQRGLAGLLWTNQDLPRTFAQAQAVHLGHGSNLALSLFLIYFFSLKKKIILWKVTLLCSNSCMSSYDDCLENYLLGIVRRACCSCKRNILYWTFWKPFIEISYSAIANSRNCRRHSSILIFHPFSYLFDKIFSPHIWLIHIAGQQSLNPLNSSFLAFFFGWNLLWKGCQITFSTSISHSPASKVIGLMAGLVRHVSLTARQGHKHSYSHPK